MARGRTQSLTRQTTHFKPGGRNCGCGCGVARHWSDVSASAWQRPGGRGSRPGGWQRLRQAPHRTTATPNGAPGPTMSSNCAAAKSAPAARSTHVGCPHAPAACSGDATTAAPHEDGCASRFPSALRATPACAVADLDGAPKISSLSSASAGACRSAST